VKARRDEVPERKYQLIESDIRTGMKSKFWLALEERLLEFAADINLELHDMQNENDFGTFKRLAGNIEAVKRVLELPHTMLIEIEVERERS
jgi:hypothetical protein